MSNADLISILKRYSNLFHPEVRQAADALEAADKRIAELERTYLDSVEVNTALQHGLYEAERKLAVAREALNAGFHSFDTGLNRDNAKWQIYGALAQIGGDDGRP